MVGRVIALGLGLVLAAGCECGAKPTASDAGTPEGFDEVMRDHAGLSVRARNALIRGELEVAQQAMRKLAFFMENVRFSSL